MDWNCVASHRLLAFALSASVLFPYVIWVLGKLHANRPVGIYGWSGYHMLIGGGTS